MGERLVSPLAVGETRLARRWKKSCCESLTRSAPSMLLDELELRRRALVEMKIE